MLKESPFARMTCPCPLPASSGSTSGPWPSLTYVGSLESINQFCPAVLHCTFTIQTSSNGFSVSTMMPTWRLVLVYRVNPSARMLSLLLNSALLLLLFTIFYRSRWCLPSDTCLAFLPPEGSSAYCIIRYDPTTHQEILSCHPLRNRMTPSLTQLIASRTSGAAESSQDGKH